MIIIQPNSVKIKGKEVYLRSYSEHVEIQIICDLNDVIDVPLSMYPERLNIEFKLDNSHELLHFSPVKSDKVGISIFGSIGGSSPEIFLDFSLWGNPKWRRSLGFLDVTERANEIAKRSRKFSDIEIRLEDLSVMISKKFDISTDTTVFDFVNQFIKDAIFILELAEEELLGKVWHPAYEKDEQLFTQQFLIPLLKEIGFDNVRYNHGVEEFGRDIIFSETDKFGRRRLLAAQVKAGVVSGGASSIVDTLVSQVHDAFDMEVALIGENTPKRISEMLVVTSGSYTNNARMKINQKIRPALRGSVIFWDKTDLQSVGGILLKK